MRQNYLKHLTGYRFSITVNDRVLLQVGYLLLGQPP
jgi:hypothetical protein